MILSFSFLTAQTEWSTFEQIKNVKSTDVKQLAEDITSPYHDELDKIKAIYYWVTHNIAYDVKTLEKLEKKGFKSERLTLQELNKQKRKALEKTLKKKKGVCQNYTNLVNALCEQINVESQLISGFSQAGPLNSGLGNPHAWNAIKYQDDWYLLDATFGAGQVQNGKKFKFDFNEAMFFVDPKKFILNHFPKDSAWQLLEKPIDEDTFTEYPWVASGFFKLGLSNLGLKKRKIKATRGQDVIITFQSATDIKEVNLFNMKSRKKVNTTFTKADSNYTLTIPSKNVRSGYYMLQSEQGILMSYRISKR